MFTSRAEYRILLRQDNADQRLTPISHSLGLASDERIKKLEQKLGKLKAMNTALNKTSISPEEAQSLLVSKASATLKQKQKAISLLNRPSIGYADLIEHIPVLANLSNELNITPDIQESLEVQVKYAGYIEKEQAIADKLQRLDTIGIPKGFDYHPLESLSSEAREKLSEVKPTTLSEASRISGVSASDLAVLLVHLGR
jgi:tRNA uridine 5-carboxymethylaminomethyl modification enzyme